MTESSKKRVKVLEYSLTLELMSSFALAYLLDIDYESIKDSKSLGNASSSLSFNQKINLLLDNKSITKTEKQKLEFFMNVRNQFMHNKDAGTYLKAVNCIAGLENKLKKIYPENFNNFDIEIALEKCVSEMFSDNLNVLGSFKGGLEKKMRAESERKVFIAKYSILEEVMGSELEKILKSIKDYPTESIKKEDLIPLIGRMKYQILLKAQDEYVKKN